MSLPHPPHQPGHDERHVFRRSNSRRRRRPSDLEGRPSDASAPRPSYQSFKPPSSPVTPASPPSKDRDPIMAGHGSTAADLARKRSLVRPERTRIDPDHPNYHYRKHAQNMAVHPSTTGNDPLMEDRTEAETVSSESTEAKTAHLRNPSQPYSEKAPPPNQTASRRARGRGPSGTQRKQRQKQPEEMRPPSLWSIYCSIITFWCPDAVLHCFGKQQKAQTRAWREKMGLLSIILLICTFVGYLTFGFTETVCPNGGGQRLRINKVDSGFIIFHGQAINLAESHHPLARGIPAGTNVLYDLPDKHGGQDGSFLFQNVNGACKGLITAAPDSDVPTNGNGELAWYFPCQPFSQDGSTQPNLTVPYYLGYACHTAPQARSTFYGLHSAGDVYFTWDDVKNSSRNLMVWGGDVLDLDLLRWFNGTQVSYPNRFDEIRQNPAVRGTDVTRAFSSSYEKQIAKCFTEIIKVGSVDTESIGCIASKVVLYVSLVFILSPSSSPSLSLRSPSNGFISRKLWPLVKTTQGGTGLQTTQEAD